MYLINGATKLLKGTSVLKVPSFSGELIQTWTVLYRNIELVVELCPA